MNAVGIDVSKNKSTVTIRSPSDFIIMPPVKFHIQSLDMMKRVLAGRMLPLLTTFFLIIIPQMVMQSRVNTPSTVL